MTAAPPVAAILLAAGSSRRFGAANKLLAEVAGVPLALAAARTLRASRIAGLIVVTGDAAAAIEHLLAGLEARFAHNPRHIEGIAGSIAAGISAVPEGMAGALIAQADMPAMTSGLIDRLIARFAAENGRRIVHPVTSDGRQRNPVIWPRAHFPELMRLEGDTGAKSLIARHRGEVATVAVDDDRPFVDLDTAAELERYDRALREAKT